MRAAILQTCPEFGDKKGNLDRALRRLEPVEADLFVLPELFSTGYVFTSRQELRGLAEPAHGETVAALAEFTRRKRCALFAGFAEADGDRVFNSSAYLVRGETAAIYRKLHLFSEEKKYFDRSEGAPVVVRLPGAAIGLMICFDWVFPEMARSLVLKGAQVLCLAANLVLPYCQKAMVTRSIENGVFSLVANRAGVEERGGVRLAFSGGSVIVGPRGELLAEASPKGEDLLVAEIDPSRADDKMITPRNHLLEDRRPDRYFL